MQMVASVKNNIFFAETEASPKKGHHESTDMDMTVNLNYNGLVNFTGEHDEVIYDEIGTAGAVGTGTGVGCRRHGVYAGNNEELYEMEPYYSIYDVVL